MILMCLGRAAAFGECLLLVEEMAGSEDGEVAQVLDGGTHS